VARGGHLHKECLEKGKKDSTPTCCKLNLKGGEKPHPSNYRGYSYAKEEISWRTPKANTGRAFTSKYITQSVFFADALQSKAYQNHQNHPRQDAATAPTTVNQPRVQTPD
jgi:hypothetical protein